MLEWILLGMTADLVHTNRKKRAATERQQQIMQIRARLRAAVTRGHNRQCKCRLCHNRRQTLEDKLAALM